MYKSLSTFIAAFLLIALSTSALSAESVELTLDQALKIAEEQNRDIAIASARLADFEAAIGEVRSSILPQINSRASYYRKFKKPQLFFQGQAVKIGSEHTYTGAANIRQLIFSGGKVYNALKASKAARDSAKADVEDISSRMRFAVINTFNGILAIDRSINVLNHTSKQLRNYLRAIRERHQKGFESDYAVMRQEVEVSNLEPEITQTENYKLELINTLKNLIAIPPDTNLVIKGELQYKSTPTVSEQYLIDEAFSNRPDLISAKKNVEALHRQVKVEKGKYFPNLFVQGNYLWQAQSDDWRFGANENFNSFEAGVLLEFPIFEGLKKKYSIRRAKEQKKIAEKARDKLHDEISSEVMDAKNDLKEATERMKSLHKSLHVARKASSIAGERFADGLVSQLELNDTILAQKKAELLYLRAVYDCIVAHANLRLVTGNLRSIALREKDNNEEMNIWR